MAAELQAMAPTARTVYALIRNSTGSIWNGTAFAAYATASYSLYTITMTEQGTASGFYVGTMPTAITAGVYSVVVKVQSGGSPAETDATAAEGDYQWNGTGTAPLSDTATSGQVGQFAPIRIARSWMIQNFPIYLKSSADHVTPLVSGICSGQIARDGGSFGPLQSGSFTEKGLGWYNLTALTSGDLNCNTAMLLFNATNVSGQAVSDPLPMALILQRVSGV